jgi:hypothetical protein
MRYRKLSLEELKPLDKEFIDFLVVNGVSAKDWTVIKTKNPKQADKILDAFSEVIFEGILRKTLYLTYQSSIEILTFSCTKEKIYLAGIRYEGNRAKELGVDFCNVNFIESILDRTPSGIKIFIDEKPYMEVREDEMFRMIEQGCNISDGKLFKAISLASID